MNIQYESSKGDKQRLRKKKDCTISKNKILIKKNINTLIYNKNRVTLHSEYKRL